MEVTGSRDEIDSSVTDFGLTRRLVISVVSRFDKSNVGRFHRKITPAIIRNTRCGRSDRTTTARNPTPFSRCNTRAIQLGIRFAVLTTLTYANWWWIPLKSRQLHHWIIAIIWKHRWSFVSTPRFDLFNEKTVCEWNLTLQGHRANLPV